MPIDDSFRLQTVISQFPAASGGGRIIPLGNAGGYSGAQIWQLQTPAGKLCLKAWPKEFDCKKRLSQIHSWMRLARQRGLHFVPRIYATRENQTWSHQAGRIWELTEWMPGKADFHDHPSQVRLEAVCEAIARLHHAWGSQYAAQQQECPAVVRRLQYANAWSVRLADGWRPDISACPKILQKPAMRALELLSHHLNGVIRRLNVWLFQRFVCGPCLCDVCHDHVLFTGDDVSGIIDYGSMKIDNVAVDLARLLGSLAGDNLELRRAGLAAYRRIRTLSEAEVILVNVLDETGTVLALANWLDRLFLNRNTVDSGEKRISERIEQICGRIESWGVLRR